MTPAADLFNLIHSLGNNEKRHFKLLLSNYAGKKKNAYRHLFNAIAAQKEYDELLIRKRLKGEVKNFTHAKHHLYQLLLRSLRVYHAGSSIENRMHEMLHNIEVLFHKALYPECGRMIKKSIQEAKLYENRLAHLALCNWQARLAKELGHKQQTPTQELDLLKDYETIVKYRSHYFEFLQEHHTYVQARSEKAKRKIRSLAEFIPDRSTLPLDAKVYAAFTRGWYFRKMRNYKRSYDHFKKVATLIEPVIYDSIDREWTWISSYINMIIALIQMEKYDEAYGIIKKIRNIIPKDKRLAAMIFYYTYSAEFNILSSIGQFEKTVKLIRETKEGLKQFKNKISNDYYINLCYIMAYSCFGEGQYTQTIEWTNKILNEVKTDLRVDLFSAARILNLIAHIEKRNYNVITYLANSAYRFLEKRKRLYGFEKNFLEFAVNKFSAPVSAREEHKSFIELKHQTEKLFKNKNERVVLNYMDYLSWLESKTENKSFAEVVRLRSGS